MVTHHVISRDCTQLAEAFHDRFDRIRTKLVVETVKQVFSRPYLCLMLMSFSQAQRFQDIILDGIFLLERPEYIRFHPVEIAQNQTVASDGVDDGLRYVFQCFLRLFQRIIQIGQIGKIINETLIEPFRMGRLPHAATCPVS